MIDKLVTLYRKAEMGVISGLSGATEGVLDETSFYDVGYMQSQINRIQRELKRITDELKVITEIKNNSEYEKKQTAELLKQREKLLFQMIFLASNSFKNLDSCVEMAKGYEFSFFKCVIALKEYQIRNKEKAFQILQNFYIEYGSVEGHFLVNKVFGILLAEKQQYQKAVMFLTYALQFIPDDIETLTTLQECYILLNDKMRAEILGDIIMVFE